MSEMGLSTVPCIQLGPLAGRQLEPSCARSTSLQIYEASSNLALANLLGVTRLLA